MKKIVLSTLILASGMASAKPAIDGWYSNVFGGFNQLPGSISTSGSGVYWDHARYHFGYDVGGSIGYKSNPLRYEAQFTYMDSETKRFSVNGFEPSLMAGESTASLLMANVYYDFPDMVPGIAPYIGGGIGYAYVTTRLGAGAGSYYFYGLDVHDSVFAYQGTAGLTYNFAENYAINIDYRYVGTSNVSSFGKIFQANLAEVGATYRFDGGHYK